MFLKIRFIAAILLSFCFIYFIVGGILVWLGWFSSEKFLTFAGIVGTLASIFGLLAFIRPAISQDDFDNLEINAIKRIAETSEQMKELEKARTLTKEEIINLENQKKQMELLVQKASLSLFLQEQKKLYERKIKEEISKNRELNFSISELSSTEKKLSALNEEIEQDPNIYLLQEIIAEAQKESFESKFDDFLISPYKVLFVITKNIAENIAKNLYR